MAYNRRINAKLRLGYLMILRIGFTVLPQMFHIYGESLRFGHILSLPLLPDIVKLMSNSILEM